MSRRAITRFSKRMEAVLKENDYKGKRGWEGRSSKNLYRLLIPEIFELYLAIDKNNAEDIQKECADVANFAMMISDNLEPYLKED